MCRPVAVLYYKQVGGLHAQLMQHFVNVLHFPPHSVLKPHSFQAISQDSTSIEIQTIPVWG